MTTPIKKSAIFMVGKDDRLEYLLQRYAEQIGRDILTMTALPPDHEIDHLQPAALIFSSMEHLQAAQPLAESLSTREIPLFVCAALSDEVRARELGADACLLHPLTYDNFRAALSKVGPATDAH